MIAADLFAVRFLFASAGCLAAGLLVWGALLACRRRLPALAMQRSGWLLGQVVVALTFALLLAPHAPQLHLLPAFEVDVTGAATAGSGASGQADTLAANTSTTKSTSWLTRTAQVWLLAYGLGLAIMLGRLWHGQRLLARLARAGTQLTAGRHPAIVEVDAPIPPMLVGLLTPRLLLPRVLRDGDPLQRELIVAHELTHWRRHDLWWLAAATALQLLFWFNPAMRLLRARLAWAQELGCDRDVLRGRPPVQRKAYAVALLAQLQAQLRAQRVPGAALAFGGVDPDTVSSRVALIRTPVDGRRAGRARWIGLAVLATAFGANLALQPALAWQDAPPSRLDCTLMIDAASGARLVEEGDCGVRVTPVSTFNIAVSLMGFDSGILRDAHTPALPFKPGYADWLPSWRATTDPSSWIRNSTVWYAQEAVERLGAPGLQDYVRRFGYGNQDLSGGLREAWIGSSLTVSPLEQAEFLRKVVNRELGLSARAYDMTAQLLRLPASSHGWDVYGKTGTANGRLADGSEDPDFALGWFVGWASMGDRTVVFARLSVDGRQEGSAAGPRLKKAFLRELPGRLAALRISSP